MAIHTFNIPTNLHGEQLQRETGATNLYIVNDQLVIESEKTKDELSAIIANHIPEPIQEITIDEKLASVGLSLDDLKAALGI